MNTILPKEIQQYLTDISTANKLIQNKPETLTLSQKAERAILFFIQQNLELEHKIIDLNNRITQLEYALHPGKW